MFISAAIVLVLGIAVIVNQNGGFGEHLGPQAALESIEATADDVPEAVDTSASEAAVPAAQAIAEDAAAGAAEDAAENAVEDAATDVPASTVRVADEVGAQTGIAANETGKAPSGPQAANAETPADY